MLGLGLGVSKVSSLRSLAAKLLAKLKSRFTYYENNKDSKQVVQDLDTIDVLDKASILLTPTAYSDARVHSVKTYTGENALTGNSSTFDTGVGDWVNYGTGQVSHASTYLRVDVATTEGGARIPVNSLIQGGQIGKTIKVRLKLWVLDGQQLFKVSLGGDQKDISLTSSPTYYDFLLKPTTTADLIIYKIDAAKTDGGFAIDDVSVVDVSSDFDFDRASSATRINSDGLVQDMQSITDPELVLNGDFEELGSEYITNGDFSDGETGWTKGGAASATQSVVDGALVMYAGSASDANNSLSRTNTPQGYNGKTYKLELTVSDMLVSSTGFIRLDSTYDASNIISFGTGTSTIYFTAYRDFTHIRFFAGSAEDGYTIDNVSVQQVDPNEYWGAGSGWSLEQGAAVATSGSSTKLVQTGISSNGKEIKTTFTISDYGGSGSVFVDLGSSNSSAVSGNGTHTVIGTFDHDDFEILKSNDFEGKISNISVKDITFSEDVDLARINYDSNGENGHWLLEPTSTNLIGLSEFINPSQAGWAEVATNTYTNNYSTAPDGNQTSTRVQFVNPNSSSQLFYLFNSTSGEYSASIYAKGSGTLKFGFYDNASVLTDEITLTSEWQRFEVTKTLQTTSNARFWIYPEGASAATDIEIWGAQSEALSYATSYIPSLSGGTVTRATETLTGSGNSTLINSTEGVLYAEIAALANDGTNRTIALNKDTNDRIQMYFDTSTNSLSIFYKAQSGATSFIMNETLTDVTLFNKIAFKWKANDFALWVNGVETDTVSSGVTSTANSLNALEFEMFNDGSPFYGKCKALAVFDEALTDTELQNLTS